MKAYRVFTSGMASNSFGMQKLLYVYFFAICSTLRLFKHFSTRRNQDESVRGASKRRPHGLRDHQRTAWRSKTDANALPLCARPVIRARVSKGNRIARCAINCSRFPVSKQGHTAFHKNNRTMLNSAGGHVFRSPHRRSRISQPPHRASFASTQPGFDA